MAENQMKVFTDESLQTFVDEVKAYTDNSVNDVAVRAAYIDNEDNENVNITEGNTNTSIVVDSALSTTSANPVQNKVITNKINELSQEIIDLKENGGGSSVQPDYAQTDSTQPDYIKNKTHGYEVEYSDTLTWDGNPEGKEAVVYIPSSGIGIYKMSDIVLSIEDFKNGCTVVFYFDGGEQTIECTASEIINDNGMLGIADYLVIVIPYDNFVDSEGTQYAKKGICFNSQSMSGHELYVKSFTIHGQNIFPTTVTKKLTAEYLEPFEVVTKGGDTLTWDGDTSGLDACKYAEGIMFYRVSDATPTLNDFAEGTKLGGSMGGETHYQDVDISKIGQDKNLILDPTSMSFVICLEDGTPYGAGVMNKGLYFMDMSEYGMFWSSLTIPGYTGFPTTEKKLKGEYVSQPDFTQNDSSKPDYIKNRPFYGIPKSIEWDTDTTTKEAVDMGDGVNVYRVSDKYFTYDELIAGYTFKGMEGETEINEHIPPEMAVQYITPISEKLCMDALTMTLYCSSDTELEGISFKTGTYSVIVIEEGVYITGIICEEIVKLPVKFIPELDYVSKNDVSSYALTINNPTGTGSFSLNRKNGSGIGTNSVAVGNETTASGDNSHAEGNETIASGRVSHSEGSLTVASGSRSHAEGYGTLASGSDTHAEGYYTSSILNGAHSEGYSDNALPSEITTSSTDDEIITAWNAAKFTLSAGVYGSHAEGRSTLSLGDNGSHSEGNGTIASGQYGSHAEGYKTVASGFYGSHAEGNGTTASGNNGSHAEGYKTVASGFYSHAEGLQAVASGYKTHAEGDNTIASSEGQHVQGRYNIEDTENKYSHIVGNGYYNARSNAHTVDWDGNAWYAGSIEGTAMILKSPSGKRFNITVSDTGTLTATEI